MSEKRIFGMGWANMDGLPEDTTLCVESVPDGMNFPTFYQCKKKRGHGPKKEYCKVHDPAAVAARQKARHDRLMAPLRRQWEQGRETARLRMRVKVLEAQVRRLGGTP